MGTVISNDGTAIAFDRYGGGPPVVLASGTLDGAANEGLAALLAERFTVINYYRRGHGKSGDTQPWAIEREVEDLGAVITEAGGSAAVFGSSGNGKFALEAAARGLGGGAVGGPTSGAGRIEKLAVWEPPYIVDDSRPPVPEDYEERLAGLLSEGRRGDMVELFMTEAVGMPAEAVAPMRETPFFGAMEAVAHTLVYDAAISGDFSVPTGRMASITIPTLVVDGGEAAWPWMRHGVRALAGVLPNAQHRTLEGQPHDVDPAALAPVLAEFFAA